MGKHKHHHKKHKDHDTKKQVRSRDIELRTKKRETLDDRPRSSWKYEKVCEDKAANTYSGSCGSPVVSVTVGTSKCETRKQLLAGDGETDSLVRTSARPTYNVEWEKYKSDLNRIFFRDDDIIKRGSIEYANFWAFLHKYVARQKQTVHSPSNAKENQKSSLGVPLHYDKSYRINFSVISSDPRELLSRAAPRDLEIKGNFLTEDLVAEFHVILLIYLDFLQKQKFSKLCKLRQSQANLPIAKFKDKILSAVQNNQVVIIAGDTGCGKSTQVPQFLAASGWKNIACTQPRRIACTSLCKRVAYETLNEYGSEIGYQIRFEKSKTQHTRILFLTEGLLLRQISTDPSLLAYDVVILDEVHERHLHSDFLLGIMKCLCFQRQDIKVILMSATINIQLFTEYFSGAPVIQVPGRLYPIQLHYYPISAEEKSTKTARLNPSPYLRVMQLIEKNYPDDERGDLLIFLSGLSEISAVVDAAQTYAQQSKRWIVLPLHSTLSVVEQDKVFDMPPEGVRKCIVSTNIAETSVTIDGVRFVADSGKVKEMSYDPTCRMQRLQEFWISKASAEQRKGRSGRTGPGVCYRLYAELEYDEMDDYSVPEIQRVPLDSLVLQMISMGLPDARKFPFIEPPPEKAIEQSIISLKEQGALTSNEQLTAIGQLLSRLPVDITIGKMLIMGTLFHMMDPILSLAAGLSVQSPFTNRSQHDPDSVAARRNLESDHGDPFTLLNAYNEWLKVKSDNYIPSKKWCRQRGLEEQRFYEITKLRQQFRDLLQDAGLIEMFSNRGNRSGSERAQRHGELKRLRELKRDYHRAPNKRKVLKLDCDEIAVNSDDEDDKRLDIKDIEFQLSHDRNQIQELSRSSGRLKYHDVILLKIILCSGLYPQVAIADDFNSYKNDTDQLFHTKTKPFVVLHPLSLFSNQPELLRLSESDIVQCPGFASKLPISCSHQLLAFMSLLETTKPYLINTTRVPALQTLCLLSSTIDTNQDFSRLVFDCWLEVQFPNPSDGQEIIMRTLSLRKLWTDILQEKILVSKDSSRVSPSKRKSTHEGMLGVQLVDFLHTKIQCIIKRLLAADLKELYVGPESFVNQLLPETVLGEKANLHNKKGGLQIRDFLVYNCLQDSSYQAYLQIHWTCPLCDATMVVSALERVQHELECKEGRKAEPSSSNVDSSQVPIDPSKKSYFCDKCQKELFMTAPEVLRHKKEHQRQIPDKTASN